MRRYKEMLREQIEKHVAREKTNDELDIGTEEELHILMENYRHACQLMREWHMEDEAALAHARA